MAFEKGSYVWIPDEEDVVLPARVEVAFSPGTAGSVFLLEKEKTVKLGAEDTKNVSQMHEQSLEGLDDMVGFKELDEFSILHNLRMRFDNDIIYTNIGRILTSVNPFKMLPIYSPQVMDEYMEKGSRNMPPHVYGVADDAFNAMIDNKKSQSCIVSGESGAGKTEATKVFLQFISEKSKRKNDSFASGGVKLEIQQKILESNPLMEAFGNAKTVRNDNSSRFGKWIEVQFDRASGSIVGGSIKNYLLEKSRIVNQSDNERNYHIFYQFCSAAEIDPNLEKYNIADATQYYYLNQSENPCTVVPSIDDKQEWADTMNAMEKIGITEEERHEILNIINIVLNVGNIQFTGKEQAAVENMDQVKKTAELMGCSPEDLERSLIKVYRGTPADPDLVGNFDLSQSCDARDAFAKHIYALLFDWLIFKINESFGRVELNDKISTIGVLDIFGFEFFENNSFEQLCINFCNEKLQGHFNDHIFKLEQEQYAAEGIDVTKIEFVDNSDVIQTIDGKGGVLLTIANELKLRTATDLTLLKKLKAAADKVKDKDAKILSYAGNKELKKKPELDLTFRVKHYAGTVTYRIEQFLEKNRDTMPTLLVKLGQKVENSFIKKLFGDSEGGKKKALGLRFSAQLKDLMKDLNRTEPHYVRCVKPNSEKVKEKFTADMVLDQLRYAGLLEVCRIRQMGYPVRRPHADFLSRYKHLATDTVSDHNSLITALVSQGLANDSNLQVGKTKVFMKTDLSDSLEEARAKSLAIWVQKIQKFVRGYLVRVKSSTWSKIRQSMHDAITSRDKALLKAAQLKYGELPYGGRHLSEFKQGVELLNQIEDEERVVKLLTSSMEARNIEQIQAALKAAEGKKLGELKEAKAARELVLLIERENVCKGELRDAIEAKDEAKLKNSVQMAKGLALTQLQLYIDAEALLKRIDDERNCRNNLQAALESENIPDIKKFMNQMADFGKGEDPLVKQAEEFVHEKAAVAAEIAQRTEQLMFQLQKAIKEKNLQALDDLEAEIIDLGLDNEVTQQAKETRDKLQTEKSMCAKLTAESGALKMKASTRAGLTKEDLEPLREILTAASAALEPDDFNLLSANDDLKKYETQLQVQNELDGILTEFKTKKTELTKEKDPEQKTKLEQELLAFIKQANEKATESGVEIQAVIDIQEKYNQLRLEIDDRHKVEREAKAKENLEKLQDATEEDKEKDEAERLGVLNNVVSDKYNALLDEAADNQRYSLDKYYRLRKPEDYVEKVPDDMKDLFSRNMLISQPKPIVKSLCVLDKKESDVAIRINKSILQYCGDLNNSFPATLAQFILMKGLAEPSMTDEIFVQLMKHITANPKGESSDRAWLLMCMATKVFPPPAEFVPYLLNFLIQRKTMPGLIGNYARLCIVQLDATLELGPTVFKPSIEDISNYRKRPPILASIHTLENKKFDFPVSPDMRVSQVLELLKRKENIQEDGEQPVWGIYVSPEEEQEVNLPRERLVRFYQHYNPSKLAHVDLFLDHWKDNTEELFQKLTHKYGPEPTEDEKTKKKGMLSLPITAAMNAVKFLGFATQKEAPPAPQTAWALPWWTHLGDVYYRMSKQKKVPRFMFKRRMLTKQEPVDRWLYLQAVHDVRTSYLPINDVNMIAHLTALAIIHEKGAAMKELGGVPELKDAGALKYIPESTLAARNEFDVLDLVLEVLEKPEIPTDQAALEKAYVESVRALPVYGMNYFYARHSASDKNYVIAVDIDGIHVLEEDRSDVKRSFVFDTIKKFGATAEYFWMNIDERQEPEKPGKFRFLSSNQGINVLLYTLQSWEMYDCVYDATHMGFDDEDDE